MPGWITLPSGKTKVQGLGVCLAGEHGYSSGGLVLSLVTGSPDHCIQMLTTDYTWLTLESMYCNWASSIAGGCAVDSMPQSTWRIRYII